MISIVTVCYNSNALLSDYVESFLQHHSHIECRANIEFILVENSGDPQTEEHAQHLRNAGFDAKVKMTENRGFGAGCNEGVALAKGELIVLANPDLIFLTPVTSLEQTFLSASWGTVLQLNGRRGTNSLDLRPEYRNTLTELAKTYRWLHRCKALYRFAYPVGSFFVVSRRAFNEVGGFDEQFFLYYEEAELSRRLTATFGPPVLCSSVKILHEGGGTQPSSEFMMQEEARSLLLYGKITNNPDLVRHRLKSLRWLARVRPSLTKRVAYLEKALKEEAGE